MWAAWRGFVHQFRVANCRLVRPVCDPLDQEACRMAVHGLELLRTARRPSLLEAVADCRRVVASCGRLDHGSIPLHYPGGRTALAAQQRY